MRRDFVLCGALCSKFELSSSSGLSSSNFSEWPRQRKTQRELGQGRQLSRRLQVHHAAGKTGIRPSKALLASCCDRCVDTAEMERVLSQGLKTRARCANAIPFWHEAKREAEFLRAASDTYAFSLTWAVMWRTARTVHKTAKCSWAASSCQRDRSSARHTHKVVSQICLPSRHSERESSCFCVARKERKQAFTSSSISALVQSVRPPRAACPKARQTDRQPWGATTRTSTCRTT